MDQVEVPENCPGFLMARGHETHLQKVMKDVAEYMHFIVLGSYFSKAYNVSNQRNTATYSEGMF